MRRRERDSEVHSSSNDSNNHIRDLRVPAEREVDLAVRDYRMIVRGEHPAVRRYEELKAMAASLAAVTAVSS
jgi:hypothetical protein